ncbi:hypothetical protein ACSX1A_05325 [Pontibacter sp. MBLB2868]|uniref:hypothetical protein n=1 Tax=Pontibacter sp. MBLB2868 TaxID=3451555 RepID=UPI003F753DB8
MISKLAEEDVTRWIKRGVWVYFLLLIFEGALRKWFLPSLATPLLLVRDPLALWLLFQTWRQGLLPSNFYLTSIILTGIIGVFTAVLFAHGNLLIAFYGARVFLLHLPLIFVIGRIFDQTDVLMVGKVLLWMALPMAVLIAIQFYSPQSAWVNRGVGGDMEGAGFGGALGYFRPPGTFSFTNGNTLFFSLVACFIIYFWFEPKYVNRLVLIGATIGLIAAIPLSISRGLFFQVGVSLLFSLVACFQKTRHLSRLLWLMAGGLVVVLILANTEFFQVATKVFSVRFESANEVEGGMKGVLGERYLGGMISAVAGASDFPIFGYGLGISTNVGINLMPNNAGAFLSDQEWERVIIELGTLMGLAVLVLRFSLSTRITFASYRSLSKGNMLPWVLMSFGSLSLLQGQWAQPTSLGFCSFVGGLAVASLRNPRYK